MKKEHFKFFCLVIDFFSTLKRVVPRNGGDAFWIIPPITYDEVLDILMPRVEEVRFTSAQPMNFKKPLNEDLDPLYFYIAILLAYENGGKWDAPALEGTLEDTIIWIKNKLLSQVEAYKNKDGEQIIEDILQINASLVAKRMERQYEDLRRYFSEGPNLASQKDRENYVFEKIEQYITE